MTNPMTNNPMTNQEIIDDDQLDFEIEQSMIAQMRADGMSQERIDDIHHNLFWYGSIHSPEDSATGENALEQNYYEQLIRQLTGKSSVG
jgi:hypothetical protein